MSLAGELRAFAERHGCRDTVALLVSEVPTVAQLLRWQAAEAEQAERQRRRAEGALERRAARRAGEPWTELDDERVRRDARQGVPPERTAAALERTVTAIRVRRSVLGCARNHGKGQ